MWNFSCRLILCDIHSVKTKQQASCKFLEHLSLTNTVRSDFENGWEGILHSTLSLSFERKKKIKKQTESVCGCFFPSKTKIICTTVLKGIIQASHIIHKLEMTLFLSTVGRAGFHLQPAIYFYNPHKKQPSPSSVESALARHTRHTKKEAIAAAFPGNKPPFTGHSHVIL